MIIVLNGAPASAMWISVASDYEITRGVKAGWRKQARVEVDTGRQPKGDGR